jgi:type IV fimbrial biogenesis protein FimT
MFTLAIAGITLALGVPSLQGFLLDSRRTADVNAFVLAVQLARSEAYKRRRPVVLCKTADRLHCGGDGMHYDSGWMVFVNEDRVSPPSRGPGEPLLYSHVPAKGASVVSNRRVFEFRPFHFRSTNGTVTFCDRRGVSAARAVIVSYTGRPRTSSRAPGNRPLVCAE